MDHLPLILASSSTNRLNILNNIGITIDRIIPPEIDETQLKKEKPRNLAARLGKLKAEKVASRIDNGYVVAADTVSSRGNLILPKAESDEDVRYCLEIFSGRRHKVYSGVTIIKVENNEIIDRRDKIVQTIIKFKKLTNAEIESYIKSKEGIGKGGGFSICGIGQVFISFISGSYSNVVGLPLFEIRNMLNSLGHEILNR